MLSSVIETRKISTNGHYNILLEIPEKEYEAVYNDYTTAIASEFLTYYLERRSDDGKPTDIQIQHDRNAHIVKITANIHYIGNDYTVPNQYDAWA